MDARWGPSPFIVMEALIPAGLESPLEEAQWSVGVMANLSHDGPRTVAWIGRDVKNTPFPEVLETWILHGRVLNSPWPPPSTWAPLLSPPFGVRVLDDFAAERSVSPEPWRGPRPWPGIVLQSPSVYEAFQTCMTRVLTEGKFHAYRYPLCWGQPDPLPIMDAIRHSYRFVIAFRACPDFSHLASLRNETDKILQKSNGKLLGMMGWLRSTDQWL